MPLQKLEKECPYQFRYPFLDDVHLYEIGVTLNPMVYQRVTGFTQGWPLIQEKLVQWLEPLGTVDMIWFVLEYTKRKMPHFHICVASEEPIPPEFRFSITKGIQRLFGRCTFTDVIDVNRYENYMHKDLEENYNKHGFSHYEIYG